MKQIADVLLTAITPILWGTTYLVTTQFLPPDRPLFLALTRALPVGLILLLFTRDLPKGIWIWRSFILGIANFTAFFPLLFIAAYRLPGGIAAMLGALSPLVVIFLSSYVFKTRVNQWAVVMGILGLLGVTLIVLRAEARLDALGILAAFTGTVSMATATVFIKKWGLPTTALNFAAWQLTAGGILLLPIALIFEGYPPSLTSRNWLGFAYLDLINTALAYMLWFRGINKLPSVIPPFLALLSPAVAVLAGWLVLQQNLSTTQLFGIAMILAAIVGIQLRGSRIA
jgi:probable blue pigment (indigoidine) exporter